MLSPASLRVCCLAVMAPALTKADRQADCLPVVLTESFCVSKTPDRFNSEDKLSELRLKCAYSAEYVQNKRKPFMQRACWRTQKSGPGFLNRYRSIGFESTKSLLCSGRVRTLRDARLKSWQSTNSTTAFAGKIKLKYTMSKNISNTKNMGLAKANTSLGLQSLKKVNQFAKENQNSGPNVMEDSLNFSDSTDSTVQMEPLISDISVLATNSDSDVSPLYTTDTPRVKNKTTVGNVSNTALNIPDEQSVSETVLENVSEPFLASAGAGLIEAMDTSNVSVTLTDLLCLTIENVESAKDSSTISKTVECARDSPTICSTVENVESARDSPTVCSAIEKVECGRESPLICSTAENVETARDSPTTSDSSMPCDLQSSAIADVSVDPEPAEIPNSSVTLQASVDNRAFDILEQSDSNELPTAESTVHTPSKVPNPVANKFLIDNESLSRLSGRSTMAKSLFPDWNCSRLLLNASKLSNINEEQWKYPLLTDYRFGLDQNTLVRREKQVCCMPTKQELESVEVMLADKAASIRTVLSRSTHLLRKQMCVYIRKQISNLVDHYQRKFQVPCQRLSKLVSAKSAKDLVDLKAELLQNEDVKSMSTAALVNLVRKLESTGTQSQIVSPKMPGLESGDCATLELDSEECEDIKQTSDNMLNSLGSLVKMSDPYFTDTSDEECTSETEDEDEQMDESLVEKSALFKYMTERAALASSSTWLLARNHELEHRIKEYDERWSDMIKTEGRVCLEEPVTAANSALATGSCNTDFQASVKHSAPKTFLPLNGFLNVGDTLHITKTSADESLKLLELESSNRTESDKEESCCRTKPLDVSAFRKRKLAFIPGLHATNPKFTRLSSVNCYCNSQSELAPCILCTGQYNSIQSVDPHSMALRDRIAILDPYFHPALSTVKDIPLCLQLENYFKIEAAKYRNANPVTHDTSLESEDQPDARPKFSELRSNSKLSQYARSLSAKYRNKHHRNSRHYRRHKLVFGKWRRLHNRNTLRARTHFRQRYSVASSDSSPDSPVHSPMSVYDDGLGYEKKRRDENQFDIDDVIIPCNSRSGRLVEIQYKEIMIPSWRNVENEVPLFDAEETDEIENITDVYLIKRHDMLEIEEKEKVKRTALGLSRRRRNRCDSRADSSGANTPDPTTLYNNQENVFRVPNFTGVENPISPASPATPNSAVVSDDSQPPFGNGSSARAGAKTNSKEKRPIEESIGSNYGTIEYDEVSPFEPLQFPLTDELYEDLVAESDHDKEVFFEFTSYSPDYPPSPVSSTSSTSTVEEEDISDPEWTVVKPIRNGPEQALVLKFAKR